MSQNIAIVFTHFNTSKVTLHHFNSLKRYNPSKKIFPVGFANHKLLESSHFVKDFFRYPVNDQLDNQVKKLVTNPSKYWSISDFLIYDFFLNFSQFDAYFFVEWDTFCNCSIEDFYGADLERDCFSPRTVPYQNLKSWMWFDYLSQEQKEMPGLGGATPITCMYFKNSVLQKMTSLLLENPRKYDNMISEMRVGSLIQQAGYELFSCRGLTVNFKESKTFKVYIENNVRGFYHPVKTIYKI